MNQIERVGVIGGGLMGSGIAEVCAKAGLDVIVLEANASAAEAALSRITGSLDRAVNRGNLDEETRDEIMELLEGLWRDRGLTLIVVTHDSAVARRAERRLHIKQGAVREV